MIVDDHMMVRDGLRVFLSSHPDIEIVAEAADGEQALARCSADPPDVVLMDIIMPKMDGPTATARIRGAFPKVQVITLTGFSDEALIQQALQAGAIGYLLKDVYADKLAEAIREAYHGRSTLAAVAARVLIQAATKPPAPEPNLTKREREVLALLVAGKTNPEIAAQLTISRGTARLHISNILAKLGVSNRTEAATLAMQYKLV